MLSVTFLCREDLQFQYRWAMCVSKCLKWTPTYYQNLPFFLSGFPGHYHTNLKSLSLVGKFYILGQCFSTPFLPTAHLRPHKNIKAHLAKFKRIHIQILRDGTTDLKKTKTRIIMNLLIPVFLKYLVNCTAY